MPSQERIFTLGADSPSGRLDLALSSIVKDLSRSRITRLIKEGFVFVNGVQEKTPHKKVKALDCLLLRLSEPAPLHAAAQDIPLEVLFEDSDIIVVNKPAGMVVHPAAGVQDGTLVNALLHHCKDLSGVGGVMRPGIVHRLDKNTSGCIVAAKNDRAHSALSEQFKARTVEKVYAALCLSERGALPEKITSPIGRHHKDRKRFAALPEPVSNKVRDAYTSVNVVSRKTPYVLLRLQPKTGRTHQIRVHLAWAGAPILGDDVYGTKTSKSRSKELGVKRQMLHAMCLNLTMLDGRRKNFVTRLPTDMIQLADSVGLAHSLLLEGQKM